MDFGALPPEVNSGLLFTGPGPSALIEAATAWNTLSTELSCMAREHTSATTALMASWNGPSAWAASTALSQFADWLTQTATLAERSGSAASQAVEAYSAARAATVPPAVVAANRTQLLMLLATNLFGQNAAAIAATEAQYGEMWAQDAAAMYGYAAASSAATGALPTFTAAPQAASGSAPAAASPWLQFIETLIPGYVPGAGLPNVAALLVSPLSVALFSSGFFTASDPLGLLGAFLGLIGFGQSAHAEGVAAAAQGAAAMPRLVPLPRPVEVRPTVTSIGGSSSVGALSVPPSWAQPQSAKPNASTPPIGIPGRISTQAGIPVLPFMPTLRSDQQRAQKPAPEYGKVSKVLPPRNPAAG